MVSIWLCCSGVLGALHHTSKAYAIFWSHLGKVKGAEDDWYQKVSQVWTWKQCKGKYIFPAVMCFFFKSRVTYVLLITTLLRSVFWSLEEAFWCCGGERVYGRVHPCIFFLRSSKLYWRLSAELKMVGTDTLGHPLYWRLYFLSYSDWQILGCYFAF